MVKPMNDQSGNLDVQNLNKGVNYMEKNTNTTVQEGTPAVQPIVNTDAVKAKAGQVAVGAKDAVGKAKVFAGNYAERVKTDKKVMVATIVVVVLVLLLIFGKFLTPGYGVVNSYMNGMKKFNAEKIVKLYHEDMYEDEDDEIDDLEERFEEYEDEDYAIKGFKIRECDKYSEDEVEDLAESLETLYDIDEDDVQAARTYYVRYTYDDDGDKGLSYRGVTVVKIDGKWYLYN